MRISVTVKPNSKEAKIERISENEFIVRVKAPPKEGRANNAVVGAMSEYLGIPKSRISIRMGSKGKNKVLEIR